MKQILLLTILLAAACGKGNNDADGQDMGTVDAGDSADVFVPLDWGDSGPAYDVGPLAETLPLELVGPPGTTLTTEIVLDGLTRDSEVSLWVRVANVVLPDSAAMEINGAYVVSLSDADGELLEPIGGWAEKTIDLDPRQLRNGSNYFAFTWDGDSADISGFRVVGLSIEVDGATFAVDSWDDPSSWAPADPSPAAAERGRTYFQNLSPNGGPVCAQCHTTSGADLQYYGYSDRAIQAYAMLLGFDANQAADLSNYIRSLDVGRDGRPWIGPFQPGSDNYGAAGASEDAVSTDAEVRRAWLGDDTPTALAWDHPAGLDTYTMPSSLQTPTWNRWLPRAIDFGWFDRANGILDTAIGEHEAAPTMETAHALLAAATTVGNELELEGEHASRVDLMRWTAVQLWDWSRSRSFYEEHHGLPDDAWGVDGIGSPAYISEVGFALFDAAGAGDELASKQALQWWLAQMSADYGRGRSTGSRPLDFHELLVAAQTVVGPNELAWWYVLGSWEESAGDLAVMWGTGDGPVRLLPVALPYVPADLLPLLWRRFVDREAEHAIGGGSFTPEHLDLFQRAWRATCMDLDSNTQEQLVATTPDALRDSIVCE